MGRFQEYKPISFDVPMFVPDFKALEELQNKKQKRLDDFNTQTDLIESSIKDSPINEDARAKKIADLEAKRGLITNELLKNPSQGQSVLKRFQSDLRNDILSGDIYKMNQRSADYEAKMKEIDNSEYGKNASWNKYAKDQLKNSYGNFYDENGFGKVEGSTFGHNYLDEVKRDALGKAYTAVATEEYETALKKDPTLKAGGYQDWWVKEGHKVVSPEKMTGVALNHYLTDLVAQDNWETEGIVQGLGAGQGKLILDEKTARFSNSTLAGKWLNSYIDAQTVHNVNRHEQLVTDQFGIAQEQKKWAREDAVVQHGWQVEAADKAAQRANDLETRRQKFELEKLDKAQELAKVKTTAAEVAKNGKLNSADGKSLTNNIITSTMSSPVLTSPTATLDLRESTTNQLKDLKKILLPIQSMIAEQAKKGINYFDGKPEELKEYMKLSASQKAYEASLKAYDKQLNANWGASELADKLETSESYNNADYTGSNLSGGWQDAISNSWKSAADNWSKGNYWSAALDAGRGLINNSFLGKSVTVGAGALDLVTNAVNMNDYTPNDIENGSWAITGKSTPIPGYNEQIAKSVKQGQTFEQFLETPVGKQIENQSFMSGGSIFGIKNSAWSHFQNAKEGVKNGELSVQGVTLIPSGYITPPEKIGDKVNGQFQDYNNAVSNAFAYGQIKPSGYNTLQDRIANEVAQRYGITDVKQIAELKSSIVIDPKSTYAISITDPTGGYYNAIYKIASKDGKSKEEGVINGEASHPKNDVWDEVYNNEEYVMSVQANHPYRQAWLSSKALKQPDQANDIEKVTQLPKGSSPQDLKQREEGVSLAAIVPVGDGIERKSLASWDARMNIDATGKYRVNYLDKEGNRVYMDGSFPDPVNAYTTFLEELKY